MHTIKTIVNDTSGHGLKNICSIQKKNQTASNSSRDAFMSIDKCLSHSSSLKIIIDWKIHDFATKWVSYCTRIDQIQGSKKCGTKNAATCNEPPHGSRLFENDKKLYGNMCGCGLEQICPDKVSVL
ncbi:MAG: hypothetical protein B6I36_11350 [Desulfobacteraceae bacterium 4572_35.1]|nr:MAG: hypothetical protein B6I36_11350 [Desulfobacteraceae bacterium 4572_35.1]